MNIFTVENLTFAYPGSDILTLDNITFSIKQGSFVTVCGMSGSGKSTMLRQFKPSLCPAGRRQGTVQFMGQPIEQMDLAAESRKIGFVLQRPENQIVTDKVWHELAFGLESLGEKTPVIRRRVAEMAAFFGISDWFHRDTAALSGGQKQLLNLAAIMVTGPAVLILDEPTAQLDPVASSKFLETLRRVNQELGTTIILAEHRLEEAFAMADRALVLENGRIIADGSPREVGRQLVQNGMFLSLPVPMRIHAAVENNLPCPVTVREGREWIDKMTESYPPLCSDKRERAMEGEIVLQAWDIWFRYDEKDVLRGFSFGVQAGRIQAIMGGNGAGKTTALYVMGLLESPWRGKILYQGRKIGKRAELCGAVGILPQDPQTVFVRESIRDELADCSSKAEDVRQIVRLCALEELLDRHPYDLSGGEQQRAALAKLLLKKPKILFLDEPTKGMDNAFKKSFGGILRRLADMGTAVVLVSHDVEFCAEYADGCAMLFDGNVVSQGRPEKFFAENTFYTTTANRMARHKIPWAITAADVIRAFGKEPPEDAPMPAPHKTVQLAGKAEEIKKDGDLKKYLPMLFAGLIAIPLTIFTGVRFLNDRKYFWISLLIILEILFPFLFLYERRRPKARELVTAAVFCGLCAAGRFVFAAAPQIKPVAALVVLAGVCFGGDMGFLVGAASMVVSDMYFGLGPWTPWQMAAMGSIGFLAGLFAQSGVLPRRRWPVAVFGGLATVVIYGGIMDFQTAVTTLHTLTPAGLAAIYGAGLVFNLIHGVSTFLFLAAGAGPLIKKLARVRKKYGIN